MSSQSASGCSTPLRARNSFANAAGIVTPLTIGLIVTATGSFVWALAFVSSITALGALCYLFMVRDLRRLPDIPSVENRARQ